MGDNPRNVASKLIVKRSLQEHEPADNTDKNGDGVNRDGSLSGMLIVAGTFTAGSTGTAVLTTVIQHSDEDDNYDDVFVAAVTHNIVVGSTGVAKYCFVLPIDFSGAQKWIRPVVNLNGSDVAAVSAHTMTGVFVLGGLVEKPDDNYDGSGYADHDLSDVSA